MSDKHHVRVFIVGAGCSAKCGYPLGIDLKQQLQDFLGEVPADCNRIKQSVSNTIGLMKRLPGIETVDQLAKQFEDDFEAWKSQRGSLIADQTYIDKENLADKQILDAKIATSAMFVAREKAARKTGLPGYSRLLDSLFGGEPWQEAMANSDYHLLTFNYDRILEIAFLDHFRSFNPQQNGIYAKRSLNSGFNERVNGGYDKVEPNQNHFCFLKLHGSTGWWVTKYYRNPELRLYWPAIPSDQDDLQGIEKKLEENEKQVQPWEPLIAFPHEKQRAVKRGTDFLADRYLEKIEAHAARVLTTATEVRIIGYSFAAIDRTHVVNKLIDKIPKDSKIIVQNMDVDTLRSRLEAYPTMRERIDQGRIEFDPTPF